MFKEVIICVMILISIIVGNYVTQRYTKDSIQELSSSLHGIKEQLLQQDNDNKNLNNDLKNIEDIWGKRHEKLAFYIEHNELEKIKTCLTSMKSYVEANEYEESINEIDKNIFLLEHIEDKYAFNLQNIL